MRESINISVVMYIYIYIFQRALDSSISADTLEFVKTRSRSAIRAFFTITLWRGLLGRHNDTNKQEYEAKTHSKRRKGEKMSTKTTLEHEMCESRAGFGQVESHIHKMARN